jgi:hypothetical protein
LSSWDFREVLSAAAYAPIPDHSKDIDRMRSEIAYRAKFYN